MIEGAAGAAAAGSSISMGADVAAAGSVGSAAPSAPMVDPLMDFLSTGSSVGNRLMPSKTSHGYLGAIAGPPDGGVSEALRAL